MRMRQLLLRYFNKGIILEYEQGGEPKTRCIDVLDLRPGTDAIALVEQIQKAEPLITALRKEHVIHLVRRLQEMLGEKEDHKFYLFKVLRAHILPLTDVAFNKSGSRFITGSYDRTFKVWDTASGKELRTLEGHRNVVYAIAFNNPYGDKIATGSFDKTCKLWSVETGKCYHTFRGHNAEIVCLSFNLRSTLVATGSMDTTAKLWDIEKGEEIVTLSGHSAEIIALSFNTTGDRIVTGSFDHTVRVWDVGTDRLQWSMFYVDICIHILEVFQQKPLKRSARVYNEETKKCIAKLEGHGGEISKVCFNPKGNHVLTASSDKTARLWNADTGQGLQILEGHTDEIFSCAFNYKGNIIITASKDNTCRTWH
ncbi:PREDICTED: dynein assembly factor with WDR repeat domains 1 [Tauraco erythrolophus]|uniref:dynein assembly factor with WDR repeat domains 1 n=1 Tax=Tauraco erythrolophus TaxID=121530 RepID=UPI00052337E2|nr:PREDICTED: dynein assembly factor with WDR repeat domains 1 [Tauraco erythrolophus]